MVFFTILTGYSHVTGAVTDCGCLGDAIKLAPWESFMKDIILLVMLTPLFLVRKSIKCVPNSLIAGVITGLAWTAMGGATLDVEATRSHEFGRGFKLTGQLGDVMKESAEIAYSYVLGNAEKLGVDRDFFEKAMLHLHVPAGATPKDGPSAGVTMTTALISLARGKPIKSSLAMTGEISLTGQVLLVGGIKEKVIAARRMKIKNLVLPEANRPDFEDLPDYIVKGIKVTFATEYSQVLDAVF